LYEKEEFHEWKMTENWEMKRGKLWSQKSEYIIEKNPFFANNTQKTCKIYIFYIIHPFVLRPILPVQKF
jgi:hypothetical protein